MILQVYMVISKNAVISRSHRIITLNFGEIGSSRQYRLFGFMPTLKFGVSGRGKSWKT